MLRCRRLFFFVAAGVVLLCSGCATISFNSRRPEWIQYPKSADSLFMYKVGHASDRPNGELAREAAYKDAVNQIAKSLISNVRISGDHSRIASSLQIRGAEILPGCVYFDETLGGVSCWVQISYPLSEKQKIMEQIDRGEKLNAMWFDAQKELRQGRVGDAAKLLRDIVDGYERTPFVSFSSEEAMLTLGDAYGEQKNFLAARQWYETVEKLSDYEEWRDRAAAKLVGLPEAPSFWPLHDRFGGRAVGFACAVRVGDRMERAGDMTAILLTDCRKAELSCTDLLADQDARVAVRLFENGGPDTLVALAAGKDVGVIIAVLLDINPGKRGTKTVVMGQETPAIDTRVLFQVIDAEEKNVVYRDEFKEIAGHLPLDRLSKRAAAILVKNYLVPECPRLP